MKLKKLGKKGVLGIDTATSFVVAILILAVIIFAVVVALSSLNNASVLTAGSLEKNQTTAVLRNVTGGVSTFMGNAGTWFSLLAIVIIILIITIVILTVKRMEGRSGGGL